MLSSTSARMCLAGGVVSVVVVTRMVVGFVVPEGEKLKWAHLAAFVRFDLGLDLAHCCTLSLGLPPVALVRETETLESSFGHPFTKGKAQAGSTLFSCRSARAAGEAGPNLAPAVLTNTRIM